MDNVRNSVGLDINSRVKIQYETYPYPDYSLFIPLRTQEAYASNSLFSAQLLKERGRAAPVFTRVDAPILIAGSGDILPFVLSFWEPITHPIFAIDISERNLQRARMRSFLRPHAFHWRAGNLEDPLFKMPENIGHIDSYGVLHHLANPKHALKRLHDLMLPGATMRVMVYNSGARTWIRHIQRSFALLGLSPFDRKDLDSALKILIHLMRTNPMFAERLTPMKASILHHSARFVDTFFHAREARLPVNYWLEAFASADLECMGLFDRYAELDDLKNPLLIFPKLKDLESRVADRRFENNFEVFLTKKAPPATSPQALVPLRYPTRWLLRMPPKAWFTFSETNAISMPMRFRLWRSFVKTLGGTSVILDGHAAKLPPATWQRLARLGAVFPSNFTTVAMKDLLIAPIHKTMDQPSFPKAIDLQQDAELRSMLNGLMISKAKSKRALEQVYRRLNAAQNP
ncbi:MAG: methyltransferase domain-containing protein [Chitinophagaceae bacterium]|nr:methyltransferase domain-containing protein [Oligoflexus sp.]